jgi:hypothetical protein
VKEITKKVYVYDDGKEFDSEEVCVNHEKRDELEHTPSKNFGKYSKGLRIILWHVVIDLIMLKIALMFIKDFIL